MASAILVILHTLQAVFSGYTLYLASISIRNLREYEEKSKKAAKYSNVAESQLYKTRTTQASGTIATLLTFLSSVVLVARPVFSSGWTGVLVTAVNVAALVAAWKHVGDFWRAKAKVPLPGVGKYNEAISKTQEIRLNIAYLAASWVFCGVLSVIV